MALRSPFAPGRLLAGALLVATLLAPAAEAAAAGGWQIYTVASGLVESPVFRVALDGRGGIWAGHISGGRAIGRRGGLVHLSPDGAGRAYTDEPLASCSSVDAVAPAPDGTLWLKLSGIHDYGSPDYLGRCTAEYGAAIGSVGADGAIAMLPKEQLPANANGAGIGVDARGRLWVATDGGAAVRRADGTWQMIAWQAGSTTALKVSPDGYLVLVGSSRGELLSIAVGGGGAGGDGDRTTTNSPPTDGTRPIVDIAFAPVKGYAVSAGRSMYSYTIGAGWQATPLPFEGDDYFGARIAYAGDTFWAGVPAYPTGLYRLGAQGWEPVATGATPLPSGVINDLEAAGPTTLLIATDQGVARLDTAAPPADPAPARAAFDALWGRSNRGPGGSWVWGPFAWAERYEPYREGPGGTRFVRYYDKTRMELPDPGADPASPWYVTNGLLVVELVRGQAQLGDDPGRAVCPFGKGTQPCPSFYPVAGDANPSTNSFAPSYAEMAPLLTAAPRRDGARVGATYTQPGDFEPFQLGERADLASGATTIRAYDEATAHNIPGIFWDYMWRQPADWLFTFGHPISEPVWVQTRIGGAQQWVLVQLFERRALTYTPGNAPEWQVEMGNVGQHYYAWRYGADPDSPPWAAPLTAR